MQDACLFDSSLLLVHINAARDAAEASARVICSLHERAVLAESEVRVYEAKHAQKAAEHADVVQQLQQCQLDCELLKQQALALRDELECELAALTAETQERESLQHQLQAVHITIRQLEHQVAVHEASRRTDAVHAHLHRRVQDLHAQIAATNCSRQSLQQRLQESSMLAQQHSTVQTSAKSDFYQQGAAAVVYKQQQQPHTLAILSSQLAQVVDTSTELSAARAALEQQLNVSKAQIVLLQQEVAKAVQKRKQQPQQQQDQYSVSSARSKPYYKRKYNELRQKNADLEAELQQLQQQKQQLLQQQEQQAQLQHEEQHHVDVQGLHRSNKMRSSVNASRKCLPAAFGGCARILSTTDCNSQQLAVAAAAAAAPYQEAVTAGAATAAASALLASACKASPGAARASTTKSTAAVGENGMPPAKRRKPAGGAAVFKSTMGLAAVPTTDASARANDVPAIDASARADDVPAIDASAGADDVPSAAAGVPAAAAATAAAGEASSRESLQENSQPEPTQLTQHTAAAAAQDSCRHQQQQQQGRSCLAIAAAQSARRSTGEVTPPKAVPGAAAVEAVANEQAAGLGMQYRQPCSPVAAAAVGSELLGHADADTAQGRSSSSPAKVQSNRRKHVQHGGHASQVNQHKSNAVGAAFKNCSAPHRQQQCGGGGAAAAATGIEENGNIGVQQQRQHQSGSDVGSSPAWKTVRGRNKEAYAVGTAAAAPATNRRAKPAGSGVPVPTTVASAAAARDKDIASESDDDSAFVDSQQQQAGLQHRKQQQKQERGGSRAKQKAPADAPVATPAAAAAGAAEQHAEVSDDFDLCTQLPQKQQQQRTKRQHHASKTGDSSTRVPPVQQVPAEKLQQRQQRLQQIRSSEGRSRYLPASMQQGQTEPQPQLHGQQQQREQLLPYGADLVPTAVPTGGISNAASAHAAHIQNQQHWGAGGKSTATGTEDSSMPGKWPRPHIAGAVAATVAALQNKAKTLAAELATNTTATEAAAAAAAAHSRGEAAAAAGPGYKYQEVVRRRAERELLPAFECDACKKFYGAIQSWGAAAMQNLGLPSCGHPAPLASNAAAAAAGCTGSATTGAAGQQQAGGAVQHMIQDASRHRAKWKPPSTPVGFWDIGFTQDTTGARYQDSP